MLDTVLLSQVKMLSVADRLELLGQVWESLSPTEVPVTEEEKRLLDERLADLRKNPHHQSPWREVQARLRERLP